MAGLNRVMIIGRLGRDPEMKYTQQGTAICNIKNNSMYCFLSIFLI